MTKIKVDAQKKMQKELELYLSKNKSQKDYFTSMKEITTWLQKKVKQ